MKECPACKRCFPDEINHCPQDGDATTPSLLGEPTLDARYQLERRLGQGGMGVVFQARHIFLKTSHAIKVILPDLVGNDPMLVTRFRQEALAAAAIRHQNIIAVTDFGVVRGTMPFLVMEFVRGRSLQDILGEEGAMSPRKALEFMCAIGGGVAAAHRQNIVHRDLKPLNIMVQEDVPVAEGLKILDFGLAKIKSGELLGSFVQAKTSGLMGSPFYMAPEQWSDEEPDSRADIYSLGIMMYQMLSGDVPFKGSSIPSIMKKHLTLPPPSFQSVGVQIAPEIEAVVRHALEKDVSARTSTVEEFLRELQEAVESVGATSLKPARRPTLDPNQTVMAELPDGATQNVKANQTNFGEIHSETTYDPQARTSGTAILSDQTQVSSETFQREQEERDRVALEELTREAEARRLAEEEASRKRNEEEERFRREKEQREELERQQREHLERVTQQAKDLEDRLARLATSMQPNSAVVDLAGTQVQQGMETQVPRTSFPGGQSGFQSRPWVEQPKPHRSALLFVGIATIGFVLLVGVSVIGYMFWPNSTTPPPDPRPTPAPTTEPVEIKPDLVQITGGTFRMGRDDGYSAERPAHQVTVASFYMDRNEVTNAEYAEFVRETNHPTPEHWTGTRPHFGQEHWPVVNVSLEDVNKFAEWRSQRDGVTYRLPTEQEWEYAARNGERQDLYPWGMEWEESRAVLLEALPASVGSNPGGNNRWGVTDLIGNVWEWTSSTVSVYPGNPTTVPTRMQDWIAVRGGSYATDPGDKSRPVSACMRDFVPASTRTPVLGFRLVRSAD